MHIDAPGRDVCGQEHATILERRLAELLIRLRAGALLHLTVELLDPPAFGPCFRRRLPLLGRLALRRGRASSVDELPQQRMEVVDTRATEKEDDGLALSDVWVPQEVHQEAELLGGRHNRIEVRQPRRQLMVGDSQRRRGRLTLAAASRTRTGLLLAPHADVHRVAHAGLHEPLQLASQCRAEQAGSPLLRRRRQYGLQVR
mmetsp:Transcript_47600/g.136926  ORF Transcript_47600/g.136926 Transcript_47600/m.136926 type:complete len:201 (+) Transcript_47600:1006-1608(+)